jgi:hypothetical protein
MWLSQTLPVLFISACRLWQIVEWLAGAKGGEVFDEESCLTSATVPRLPIEQCCMLTVQLVSL